VVLVPPSFSVWPIAPSLAKGKATVPTPAIGVYYLQSVKVHSHITLMGDSVCGYANKNGKDDAFERISD